MKRSNSISIMTFVFAPALSEGKLTLEELTAGLKAIGFDGLEIFLSDLIADARTFRKYKSLLKSNDLKLACIDAICDFVSADATERRNAVEHLRVGIETAGELECSRVMLAGSMEKQGISLAEGRKMIADGIASQVDLARQAGVTLMVEDYGMARELMCRTADCLEVIELCGGPERVKFTFDTGNFLFAGEDPEENIETFLPVIHHVHIKAWRALADRQPGDSGEFGGYIGCPIGEGVIPNEPLVRRIQASGYDGWFSLECGALLDPLAGAKRDYDWLTRWLK
jgi:sugar phosphate isomerase/epimerase